MGQKESIEPMQETQRLEAKTNRRGKGFTLVELLVVIAIISGLAALLLPALEKAIQSARQVECLSHQREIGRLFSMHALDHDGMLPYRQVTNADPEKNPLGMSDDGTRFPYPSHRRTWHCQLAHLYSEPPPARANKPAPFPTEGLWGGIWSCPSYVRIHPNAFSFYGFYSSYAAWGEVWGPDEFGLREFSDLVTSKPNRLGRVSRPSRAILSMDGKINQNRMDKINMHPGTPRATNVQLEPAPEANLLFRNVHGGLTNVLFLDEHAIAHPVEALIPGTWNW